MNQGDFNSDSYYAQLSQRMGGHRHISAMQPPRFFYGTAWKEEQTAALTLAALRAGFRAIDTANQRKHYHEAGAGAGVKAFLGTGACMREDLFLQTKFTFAHDQDHRLPYDSNAPLAAQVAQSCASSLAHLQTSYIDSYILHGGSNGVGCWKVRWPKRSRRYPKGVNLPLLALRCLRKWIRY